jgi:hypothetical protein
MSRLLALLAGWKGYAALGLLSASLAASAASYVTALGYRLTIAQMQADRAGADARRSEAALASFTAQIGRMQSAAQALEKVQGGLGRRFDDISKDLQDAIKSHPLPSGCMPDAGRMRALNQAVAATNAATGAKLGGALPDAD